jgi:hypothetical protein
MGRLDVPLRRSTSGWTSPRSIDGSQSPVRQRGPELNRPLRLAFLGVDTGRRHSFRQRRALRQRGEPAVRAGEDNEAAKSLADEVIGMPGFIAGDSLTTLQ